MSTRSIDLTLEFLSPCFLGGAYQEPEFRIASLRGIWRYWYRALYGHGDATRPSGEELAIFGSTERRGLARVVPLQPPSGVRGSGKVWPKPGGAGGTGADYLLFTMAMNGREYLEPGQRTSLRLLVDRDAAEPAVRSLAAACAFSGLGARSRRMAGALGVRASTPGPAPFHGEHAKTPEDLASRLRSLLEPALDRSVARAEYHVVAKNRFSAGVLERDFAAWRDALDFAGAEMRSFRLRRQPDYDIAKRALRDRQMPAPDESIRRAAFGLPIQFRFKGVSGSLPVRLPESDRRGSPLFLTLERLASGRLAVVWCLFRSTLTPDGQLRMGGVRVGAPDLSIIDELLREKFQASHTIA